MKISETLHTKYRPKLFQDILGNDSLVEVITYGIRTGKLPHTLLITGTPGNGKTTTARIIAKSLNCQHRSPQGEPCNTCDSCLSADTNSNMNISEMDCGLQNRLEDIRQLHTQTDYGASRGGKLVVIMDEVHRLQHTSQSALLKKLEEAPEYCYFILVTSEDQKLSKAIHSRCTRYYFQAPSYKERLELLAEIANQEEIELTPEGLSILVRRGEGVRDTIQNLTLCQGLSDLSAESIANHLKDIADSTIIGLAMAIYDQDITKVCTIWGELDKAESDLIMCRLLECYKQVLRDKALTAFDKKHTPDTKYQKILDTYDLDTLKKHFKILSQWERIPKNITSKSWLECLLLSMAMGESFDIDGVF